MKIVYYSLVVSVILSACSSSTDENTIYDSETKVELMTFNATISDEGGDTRIYVSPNVDANNKYSVLWSADDAISVFNIIYRSDGAPAFVNSTNSQMTLTSGAGTNNATFSGECTTSRYGYVAAYPYDANTTYITDGSRVTYNWNSTQQTACLNSFPTETLMLANCSSEMTGLKFKHVYSFIKFTTNDACTSVTLKAHISNATIACNSFDVQYDCETGMPASLTPYSPSTQITLTGKDGAKLAAGTYYIAVLPCSLVGGFEIAFFDKDTSSSYIRSTAKNVTMTRAKALNLGMFDLQNAFTGQSTTQDLDPNVVEFVW